MDEAASLGEWRELLSPQQPPPENSEAKNVTPQTAAGLVKAALALIAQVGSSSAMTPEGKATTLSEYWTALEVAQKKTGTETPVGGVLLNSVDKGKICEAILLNFVRQRTEKVHDTVFLSMMEAGCRNCFRRVEGLVAEEMKSWFHTKIESGSSLDSLSVRLQPLLALLSGANFALYFPSALDGWMADLVILFAIHPSTDKASHLLRLSIESYCHSRMATGQPIDRLLDAYRTTHGNAAIQQRFTDALWSIVAATSSTAAFSAAVQVLKDVLWPVPKPAPTTAAGGAVARTSSPGKPDPIAQLLTLTTLKDAVENHKSVNAKPGAGGATGTRSDEDEAWAIALRIVSELVNAAALSPTCRPQSAICRACQLLLETVGERLTLLEAANRGSRNNSSLGTQSPNSGGSFGSSNTATAQRETVLNAGWTLLAEASVKLDGLAPGDRVVFLPYLSSVAAQSLAVKELLQLLETESIVAIAKTLSKAISCYVVHCSESLVNPQDPTAGIELLDGIEHSISQGYPTSENITTLVAATLNPALQGIDSVYLHPGLRSSIIRLLLRCLAATITIEEESWAMALVMLAQLVEGAAQGYSVLGGGPPAGKSTAAPSPMSSPEKSKGKFPATLGDTNVDSQNQVESIGRHIVALVPLIFNVRFACVDIPPLDQLMELLVLIVTLGHPVLTSAVLKVLTRVQCDNDGFLSVSGVESHKYACRFLQAKHFKVGLVFSALADHRSIEGDVAFDALNWLFGILISPYLTESCRTVFVKHLPAFFLGAENFVLYTQPSLPDHMKHYLFCIRLVVSHASTTVLGGNSMRATRLGRGQAEEGEEENGSQQQETSNEVLDEDDVRELHQFLLRTSEKLCTALTTDPFPRAVYPAALAVVASNCILQRRLDVSSPNREHGNGGGNLLIRWAHTLQKLPANLLGVLPIVNATLRHLHEVLMFDCLSSVKGDADCTQVLSNVTNYCLQFISPQRTPCEVFLAELVLLTWLQRANPQQRHRIIQGDVLPFLAKTHKKNNTPALSAGTTTSAPKNSSLTNSSGSGAQSQDMLLSPMGSAGVRNASLAGTAASSGQLFTETHDLLEVLTRFLWRTTYVGTDSCSPVGASPRMEAMKAFFNAPCRSWCLNALFVTVAHRPDLGKALIVVRGPSAVLAFQSQLLNPPAAIDLDFDFTKLDVPSLSLSSNFLGGQHKDPVPTQPSGSPLPSSGDITRPRSNSPEMAESQPLNPAQERREAKMTTPELAKVVGGSQPKGSAPGGGGGGMNMLRRVFSKVTSRQTMYQSKDDLTTREDGAPEPHPASPEPGHGGSAGGSSIAAFPNVSSSAKVESKTDAPTAGGDSNGASGGGSSTERFIGGIASIYPALFSPVAMKGESFFADVTTLPHLSHNNSKLVRSILNLDKTPCTETTKIGVLYLPKSECRRSGGGDSNGDNGSSGGGKGTTVLSDVDMMKHTDASDYFWSIINTMGEIVPLQTRSSSTSHSTSDNVKASSPTALGADSLPASPPSAPPAEDVPFWFPKENLYTGGLRIAQSDEGRRENDAGEYFLRYTDGFQEVAFHVAPLMPTRAQSDPSCTKKKRHIGNDSVVVLICDDALLCSYDSIPHSFRSEVTDVYIVVERVGSTELSRITVRFRDQADPGLVDKMPSTVTKIVPTTEVGQRVSALAMHINVIVKAFAYHKGQRVMNGVERLKQLRVLQSQCHD